MLEDPRDYQVYESYQKQRRHQGNKFTSGIKVAHYFLNMSTLFSHFFFCRTQGHSSWQCNMHHSEFLKYIFNRRDIRVEQHLHVEFLD